MQAERYPLNTWCHAICWYALTFCAHSHNEKLNYFLFIITILFSIAIIISSLSFPISTETSASRKGKSKNFGFFIFYWRKLPSRSSRWFLSGTFVVQFISASAEQWNNFCVKKSFRSLSAKELTTFSPATWLPLQIAFG